MGTTLTGKRVQNTYDSLIKISDNNNLSGVAKILGDGLGNDSPIYLSTSQIGIGITPSYQFHTSGNAKIGGNLIISGDLTVNGTLTYLNVTDLAVEDPLIKLAKDNTANTLDIGLFGKYVATGTKYKGFYNDASDDKFKLFIGTTVEPTTTVDTSASGYTVGTLVANLEGNADTATGVLITADNTNASRRMVFTQSNNTTNTNGKLFKDSASNFFYNPSSNRLTLVNLTGTTGTFSGLLKSDTLELTSGDDHLTITESSGDWTINNAQQNNGITIYDGTGGIDLKYSGTSYLDIDVNGVSVAANIDFYVDTNTLYVDAANNLVGIGKTPSTYKLDVSGKIASNNYIIAGLGSGGTALTHNDGGGNANITFNHVSETPEQDGSSGRISVLTDSTTAKMSFELKDDVTADTEVNTAMIMELYTSSIIANRKIRARTTTGGHIYFDRNDTTIGTDNHIGTLHFSGDDPTDGTFNDGAAIKITSVSDWSANNYPSRIELQTDNAGTLTTALTINESQNTTFSGDITIAKTDPTITLFDNSGANTDPNGKIIFSELADQSNFEISYNGLNDRLEFIGLVSNVLTDLVYIKRNTTTTLNVLGGATFSGLVTGIAPTSDLNFATKKYVDDNIVPQQSLSNVLGVGNTSGANDIIMADDQKISFGDDSDLNIKFDGTNSTINNKTGNLNILVSADDSDISFQSDNGSGGTIEYFRLDGSTNTVPFGRSPHLPDALRLYFGNDTTDDASIRWESTASQLFIDGESKFLEKLIANNNFVAQGTVDLNVMPTHQSEGSIKIGRYDGNTTRFHLIKNYVSTTLASNYMKFSLHNDVDNDTTDVLSLFGDGNVEIPNGTLTSGNITVSDDGVPQLILNDTGNAGGGGASGKIIYKNTAGNAIGLGYTADDTTSSDFIISSNASSTYGGYLGLDAGAISDPSQIILDPKTDVYSTKPVTTANVFIANDLDVTNTAPSTDQLRASGYGIIGNRAGFLYITNAASGGTVQIGNGTSHNADATALFNTSLITLSKQTLISAKTTIGFGQITTNIGTTSHLRIQPTATTDTTGKTSIFLGTSTVDNYGISLRGARFGDTGTPKFEIAVHNNSANGSVALEIDQFINTHIKGELFIEDVDNATAADTDKVLVMSNESGEVQYRTPNQLADDMNVPTGFGGAGLIPIYETTDTFTTNSNLYWDIANGRLGLGDTTPSYRLDLVTGTIDTAQYSMRIHHSRNDPDQNSAALFIDANYTGTKSDATDIIQRGLHVDFDSSANGTAADEHRIYGIHSDTRNSGFADIVYGTYSLAESNYTGGKTANVGGVYGIATHDSSSASGGVTNLFGVKGIAQIQDDGDVDNSYGGQFQVLIANNRDANVDIIVGVEAEIQIDEQSALTYGGMHGFRAIIDNNEGAVPTFGNQFLFKGDYQGTRGSAAYGIYSEGDRHYFEGMVSIGNNNVDTGLPLNIHHATNSQIRFSTDGTGTGTSDGFRVGYNGTVGQLYLYENADIRIATNNTPFAYFTSDQKFGIGTDDPAGQFNSYISATRQLTHNGNGGDLSIISDNNSAPVMFIKGTGTADLLNVFNGSTERLKIDSSGNQTLNLSSTTTQFIGNSSGTLVIKNTTGGINFMANGSTVVSAYITSSLITLNEITQINNRLQTSTPMGDVATWDSAVIRVNATNTIDTTGFLGMRFATSTANNYGWRIGANRTGSGRGSLKVFEHINNVAGAQRFVIKPDGNVGIGVGADPTHKLGIHNNTSGAVSSQMNFTTASTGQTDGNGFRVGWNGTVAQMYLFENADMRFATSGTERMVLAADGDLKIARYLEHLGDTNSYLGWSGGDDFRIVTGSRELLRLDEGTDPDILKFMTNTITMSSGGDFTAAKVTASGDVIAFSDKRVKTNIKTISNGLEKVSKLRGVSYNRTDVNDKSNKIGVIAQEVQEVLPEVVNYDNKKDLLGVDYGKMAGVFIEAIKELKAEVDSLKQEIKQLKK
jgi:hypothetical protein